MYFPALKLETVQKLGRSPVLWICVVWNTKKSKFRSGKTPKTWSGTAPESPIGVMIVMVTSKTKIEKKKSIMPKKSKELSTDELLLSVTSSKKVSFSFA